MSIKSLRRVRSRTPNTQHILGTSTLNLLHNQTLPKPKVNEQLQYVSRNRRLEMLPLQQDQQGT
jgi:hypothetical protein